MSSSSIPGIDPQPLSLPGLASPPPGEAGISASATDERRVCMERAGKLLTRRARSERELRDRLADAGFEEDVVDPTIERLSELDLVDDHDFARRWIDERAARKSLGPATLRAELTAKGVDRAVIDDALEAAGLDEEALATELAARLVRRVARKPLAQQGSALWVMLRRKGYSSEACEAAVKAVMPPEGWD